MKFSRLASFVGGVAVTAGVFGLYRHLRVEGHRALRYADAIPLLNGVYGEVAQQDDPESPAIETIEGRLCRIANQFAAAFTLIAGTRCAVCMKAIVQGASGERLRVATLCRDETSRHREQGVSPLDAWICELEDPQSVSHYIDANTAFERAYLYPGTIQAVFLSNNLPLEKGYRNTSFGIVGDPPGTEGTALHKEGWPLPYKSTIVAPIGRQSRLAIPYLLLGYLAVDSPVPFAFEERRDIEIVFGVANALAPMLERYQRLARQMLEEGHDEGEAEGE